MSVSIESTCNCSIVAPISGARDGCMPWRCNARRFVPTKVRAWAHKNVEEKNEKKRSPWRSKTHARQHEGGMLPMAGVNKHHHNQMVSAGLQSRWASAPLRFREV